MATSRDWSAPSGGDLHRGDRAAGPSRALTIIRARDEGRYLGAEPDGIAERACSNLEVLLVDTGSADATVRIAWSRGERGRAESSELQVVDSWRPCHGAGGIATTLSSKLKVVETVLGILNELAPAERDHRELLTFVSDRPGHDFRYAVAADKIRHELG